jgi:hypothetical protein
MAGGSGIAQTLEGITDRFVLQSSPYLVSTFVEKWSIGLQICELKKYYVCRHGN